MSMLTLEHSPFAYQANFVIYGGLCLTLTLGLVLRHPPGSAQALSLWVVGGGALWTLAEYLLPRCWLRAVNAQVP